MSAMGTPCLRAFSRSTARYSCGTDGRKVLTNPGAISGRLDAAAAGELPSRQIAAAIERRNRKSGGQHDDARPAHRRPGHGASRPSREGQDAAQAELPRMNCRSVVAGGMHCSVSWRAERPRPTKLTATHGGPGALARQRRNRFHEVARPPSAAAALRRFTAEGGRATFEDSRAIFEDSRATLKRPLEPPVYSP